MNQKLPPHKRMWIAVSGLFWCLGFVLYFSFTGRVYTLADLPVALFLNNESLQLIAIGSMPSFLHAMASATMLVAISLKNKQQTFQHMVFLWLTLLLLETLFGTFDWLDVAAMSGAIAIVTMMYWVAIIYWPSLPDSRETIVSNRPNSSAALVALAGSALLAMGSVAEPGPGCARYEGTTCVAQKRFAQPQYLSYAELRSSIQVESAHALNEIGRIYLYRSLIFMNERNEGIHVIDNRFPSRPTPIAFIRIPGNLDVNIRGNYLYADSYVDLVTLDLNDLDNIVEVKRETDIFPFDAFQNIPNDIDFYYSDIDASRGVIVGYNE